MPSMVPKFEFQSPNVSKAQFVRSLQTSVQSTSFVIRNSQKEEF